MLITFTEYFPQAEKPCEIVLDDCNEYTLPPGRYIFEEEYCSTPLCDCRQAHFQVKADWTPKPLADIDYGWETTEFYKQWLEEDGWEFDNSADLAHFESEAVKMAGVSLNDYRYRKNRYGDLLVSLFKDQLSTDAGFQERIKRHYQMVRDAVEEADKVGRELSMPPNPKQKKVPKKKTVYPDPLVLPEGFHIAKCVSPEIVRQALLSPIEVVRAAAASYFDRSDVAAEIPDCGVMQTVIEAIEKYGYENSLRMIEDRKFPQNERTIRWITDELDKEHDLESILADNYCLFLVEMLCLTDPALLSETMVDLRCFPKEKKHEFLVRLEFAKKDWHDLWQRAIDGFDDDEIELWEALARHTDHKETVLRALQGDDPTITDYRLEDLLPSLIDLAADMRLTEALPWVVREILRVERSGFSSIVLDNMMELSSALVKLADEETLDMFQVRWLDRPHKHTWFVDVLVDLKTPWSMNACLAVLQKRRLDKDTRRFMAEHLMDNFVSEALSLIIPFEPELATDAIFRQSMVVAHLVNPIDNFIQFEQWKTEAEKRYWNQAAVHERFRYERLRLFLSDDESMDEEDEDFDEEDDGWDDEGLDEPMDGDDEDFDEEDDGWDDEGASDVFCLIYQIGERHFDNNV
jgi:hypothetical protein